MVLTDFGKCDPSCCLPPESSVISNSLSPQECPDTEQDSISPQFIEETRKEREYIKNLTVIVRYLDLSHGSLAKRMEE